MEKYAYAIASDVMELKPLKLWDDNNNPIAEIDKYFISGNSVPVTRATITLEEWELVKDYINYKLAENI